MPVLGAASFADKRTPASGCNLPTPYIQVYTQEKVSTYAPFGSKPRGSQILNAILFRYDTC